MTIRELREWFDDAGFVAFLVLLPGIAALAWREHRREKRQQAERALQLLDESFRRAKKLDPSSDSHRR